MGRLASVFSLAVMPTIGYAEEPHPPKDLPRYQIVSTSEGLHSIFRVGIP